MAAVQRIQRRAINLLPTSRATSQGVPIATYINLKAAPGPGSDASHDAHHGDGSIPPRHDMNIPKWATKIDTSAGGVLHLSSRVNGEYMISPLSHLCMCVSVSSPLIIPTLCMQPLHLVHMPNEASQLQREPQQKFQEHQ